MARVASRCNAPDPLTRRDTTMGRPKKYATEEERVEALKIQKREYFRRNAPRLNAARRGRVQRRHVHGEEKVPQTHVMQLGEPSAQPASSATRNDSELPALSESQLSFRRDVLVAQDPLASDNIILQKRPQRYLNRVLGTDGPELRARWKEKYADKPLDCWLKERRKGLRRSLSLLQELQGRAPSVILARHFYYIWDSAVNEVIDSDFVRWGKKIFEILTKDDSPEDTTERIRACKRLSVHLRGLVEVINDLAVLARQVDPKEITTIVADTDSLKRKASVIQECLDQMLKIRNRGAGELLFEELSEDLLFQKVEFDSL